MNGETHRGPPRRARPGAGVVCGLLAMLAACTSEPPATQGAPGATDPGAPAAHALPPGAPERFGFGAAASGDRIALWDIDVKPDGEGLPPGSGSVAEGRLVYERSCMQCHGATGTEGPNDRLVAAAEWDQWPPGRAFGAYWPYATTFFDYTRRAMPMLTPGTMSSDDLYAVTAYVLHLNGLLPEDAVLDAESLAAIEMPARDRFVPDDRAGGPEVR